MIFYYNYAELQMGIVRSLIFFIILLPALFMGSILFNYQLLSRKVRFLYFMELNFLIDDADKAFLAKFID